MKALLSSLIILVITSTPLSVQAQQNTTNIDPYAKLGIILNPNGTITRPPQNFPTVPPNISSNLVISKDAPLNQGKDTWVRIYLPAQYNFNSNNKLPIVVFAHGGGFVVLSANSPNYNALCSNASYQLNALVVSVNYRNAPEHRLPAAYDDVLEALYWIKEGCDEWVAKYGDVTRLVLMGTSSGANIVYNVGLKATTLIKYLEPLTINGLVLVQPFFGGSERTESELKLFNDTKLPLVFTDLLWNLSLPIGTDRSHMFCDPSTPGRSTAEQQQIRRLDWPVIVMGSDLDPIIDRQMAFVQMLQDEKVNVIFEVTQGDQHGAFVRSLVKLKLCLIS